MAGGRPTKLTKETQAKIVEAVRAGAYIETASAFAGIDKASLYAWMKRGNAQTKGIYREFLNAIEKAFADSELRDIMNIGNAAKENWQASAWRLERRFPDRWGRKEKINVDANVKHSGEVALKEEHTQRIVHELLQDPAIENRWLMAVERAKLPKVGESME